MRLQIKSLYTKQLQQERRIKMERLVKLEIKLLLLSIE